MPSRESALVRALTTLALLAGLLLIGGAGFALPDREPVRRINDAGVERPAAAPRTAPDPDAPAEWPDRHVVAPGETLGEIAERYTLSSLTLARANALGPAALIRPGDVLVLPDPERELPRSARTAFDEAPKLARLLGETAREFGWRPATVQAVAWAESRWDHGRVSSRGAIGIMQVRPETAEAVARELGRELDPYDLEDNVLIGVAYLDRLHDRYDGDVRRILAAYVQGPTRLDAVGVLPEAEQYAARVLHWRELFAAAALPD